jgi:uncharacterized protein
MTIESLEESCRNWLKRADMTDAAHDLAHIERVVANAKKLLRHEKADAEVTLAAAWLHDCVSLPKDHPQRDKASVMAAGKAQEFLDELGFSKEKSSAVGHAVESHSFSAGIPPETIEAQIVQDADRLDALGAIGVSRCLMVGGSLDRPLYNPDDPFCEQRDADDSRWNVDHFYVKLFRLPATMNTKTARDEAHRRVKFMEMFLDELKDEIRGDS